MIHEWVIFNRSSTKFNFTIHQSPHGFTNTKARASLTIEETTVHRISIDWTIGALIISHELNFICWANCLVWWFCNSYSPLQGLPGQILPQQHRERSQEMMTNFFWSVTSERQPLVFIPPSGDSWVYSFEGLNPAFCAGKQTVYGMSFRLSSLPSH